MKSISIYVTLCCLLCCSVVQAQSLDEVKAEIAKITKAYSRCRQLTIEAGISEYAHASDQRPESSEKFFIKIQGGLLYYKMDQTERISNLKYSIILDHQDKLLVLDKGSDLQVKGDPRKFFQHEEMLAQCSSIRGYQVDKDTKRLSFRLKELIYYSVEFEYNSNTYLLEKVVIVYNDEGREGSKVSVLYTKVDPSTAVDVSVFSERKYVSFDKQKRAKVKETYKDYLFVNHLN